METEQITKNITDEDPSRVPQVKKQKDPKKVKAGNALARKNAEARKLIKQDEDEEISSQGESSTNVDVSTIYNGILSIAGLVGAGFTLYHGWKFFETSRWSHYSNSLRTKLTHSDPQVEKGEKSPSVTPKKSIRKSVDF